MAEELNELRAAIRQELELARSGDGYEEGAVADEIVDRYVLPLFEPMRAKHYTPYVDEEHQGGYCFDFFAPTLARVARAERERDLLLWLHAEAVWQREQAELETTRATNTWRSIAEQWERGHNEDVLPYTAKLEADVERERASRQAWAEEAMRLDTIGETLLTAVSKYDERLRFVAARYLADGSGANFRSTRCTGVSSDALAWYAVERRDEPKPHEYPLDPSDLAACERTYEMAPEFLRERMDPVLAKYRAAVAKRYPEVAQRSVHPDGVA